jgi:hypothetical protein
MTRLGDDQRQSEAQSARYKSWSTGIKLLCANRRREWVLKVSTFCMKYNCKKGICTTIDAFIIFPEIGFSHRRFKSFDGYICYQAAYRVGSMSYGPSMLGDKKNEFGFSCILTFNVSALSPSWLRRLTRDAHLQYIWRLCFLGSAMNTQVASPFCHKSEKSPDVSFMSTWDSMYIK